MRDVNRPTPTPIQEIATDIGVIQGNWLPNDLATEWRHDDRIRWGRPGDVPQYRGDTNSYDLNGICAFNGGERLQTLQVSVPHITIKAATLGIRETRELKSIKSCSGGPILVASVSADTTSVIAPPNNDNCCGGR